MKTIYETFVWQVQLHPEAIAIIHNGISLSYQQLDDYCTKLAEQIGVYDQIVGVVMDHGIDQIALILALLKNGNAYVPAEPSFPRKRIASMMEEAGCCFVITTRKYERLLENQNKIYIEDLADDIHPPYYQKNRNADHLAYILFTSGSTGRPKGVQVTNENVVHYARAFEKEFHIGPADRMLQYSVCSFDIFVEEVFAALLNGAALVVPARKEKEDLSSLMQFIEDNEVTIFSGFPYLLEKMNHLPSIPSSLRLLISGGDVLKGKYVDHLLDQVVVYNTYGPSETTVCSSYYKCNGGTVLEDGTYPIGHSILNVRMSIVDEEGHEIQDGKPGEIIISGSGVSNGYAGDHKKENEAFRFDKNGEKVYFSGDLGYVLPDGNFAFLHRKDDQIMIYGKRVEMLEVQSRLNQCSGIEDAVVRTYLDEQNLNYMVAYLVCSQSVTISQLKKELSENLTDFMIPEYFVILDRFVRNENGKIDFSTLPVILKEGKDQWTI